MAAGDVFPKRNLPPQSEDWGRKVEERLIAAERSLDGTKTSVSNANRAGTLALDATAAQGSQIVEVKDQTTQTQQEQIATKQIDSSNLFDLTPLAKQDASGWDTWAATTGQSSYENVRQAPLNITAWYEDGFEITSLEAGYVELRNKERYRNTGPVFPTAQVQIIRDNDPWNGSQQVSVRAIPFNAAGQQLTSEPTDPPTYRLLYGAYETGYNNVVRDGLMSRQEFANRPAFNNPSKRFDTGTSTFVSEPVATWVPAFNITFSAAGQKAQVRGLKMQQISPDAGVIGQPGVNLFDTRPITEQNTIYWDMENVFSPTWYSDGFQIQTPSWNGSLRSNLIFTRKFAGVKPGQVLSFSVTLGFSTTQNGAETNGIGQAGFGYTFYNDDGTPRSSSASAGTDQSGLYTASITIPPGTSSVRVNLYSYVPSSYPNPQGQIWVKFRNPYFGLQVSNAGYQKGSITQDKLDPSITFGVADNSLTTAKYQDLSVTDSKISGMSVSKLIGTIGDAMISALDAAKLTGTILLARLPATIGGRTLLSGTDVTATTKFNGSRLVSSRGEEVLPGYFQVDNLRSNNATTYTQTVPNATWFAMNIPTAALASHVTTYNTMGIGISGTGLYVPTTGLYEFDVNGVFGNATGGTARSIAFSVNGSTSYVWESANRQTSYVNAVLVQRAFAKLALNANDYVQIMFRQDSGVANGLPICRIENLGIKFIGSS